MYPVPSYECIRNEMGASAQFAEARNPGPCSEDRNPWLQSTNWEVSIPSGSPYQTEEQEEDEKACCVLVLGYVPFKVGYFSLCLPKHWVHLQLFCVFSQKDCFEMAFVADKDLSFSI